MGITEIIKRNGEVIKLNTKEPFCVVKQATQNSSLMGDDSITLQIISSECLTFSKGDKIVVDGFDYTIRTTTTREIQGERYNTFEPVFYGPMFDLMKTLYRNCDENGKSDRSNFDLTYTIKEFVKVLINNLNRDYPGLWAFNELNCPETEARTIQFSGNNCLQVLQTLCSKDNFNLEFLITQSGIVRTIHIGKFGQRVNPPGGASYFEWGKGNGLYKLKEQKIDDKAIITRLWVEGGTTNIRTDYRNYSERLQLPYPRRLNRKKHILYDGTVIEPNTEMIGIANDADRYLEDAQLAAKIGSDEDCKTYDNIFPTRTGKVTALVDGDINAFIDDTMDFDLCAKNDKGTIYLVNDVSAKITFTSGRLAGQQFELNAKGGYDHATKKFKLIPFTDNRGLTTPTVPTEQGGAYPIEVGDTYKITDIFLPESYEQNAEEDLWYAGMDDFKQATQAKAQYVLTLDRLYFLEALSRDSEVCVFKVGDYVPVKDTRFGIEKQIRIQKITRNLLLEQDYQLTLSDTTAITISTQTVLSVIDHERIINNNRLRDLSKIRRGWRTTEDLRNMVYDTDGFFDVDNIRPNSIDTNMLTVGSKSQQFVLSGVILQANVNGNPNSFAASTGILSHLTIDPNKIRAWEMSGLSFTLPSNAGYYLFAKCSKDGETGTWVLSQTQYTFEPTDDPNNYYFLVGVLSALYSDDNFRDFVTTYGFTRINGNTITTGRIVTSDGECYLDLDGNKFRIGDASSSIDWNVCRTNAVTLKNVSVISESGDVAPIGVYRGVWNSDYVYYPGDEISYTDTDGDGATCTYRYNNPTPSKGHKPTESAYWIITAKGANGIAGNWVSNVFIKSDTKPAKPTGTAPIPQGWSDAPNATGKWWMSKATVNGETGLAGAWSEPIQVTGEDGVDGPYTDFKYSKNSSPVNSPDIDTNSRNPQNWSDTPPDLSENEYLWMSTAEINADDTLKAAWSTPVRISGEKGANGIAGNWVSNVFIKSDTKPAKPTGTAPIPQGWSDAPNATGKWWMSKATVNGETGLAGAWSEPIQVTGEDGVDGPYTDFKYSKNNSKTEAPTIEDEQRNPTGWSDEPPTLNDGEYLWMSQADIYADNTLKTNWSYPIRISGEKGEQGINGDSKQLVFKYSIDKPTMPTGTDLIPAGWSDTPDREAVAATHGTVFTLNNGYYVSPAITHNEITKNRITLVTTKPNQTVAIEIWAQCEYNFDFVLVGKLDTEGLTRTTNYLDRLSGTNAKKVVYVHIPTAGTHFVDVAYAKDQSSSASNDCGSYRIVAVNNCWLSVGTVDGENEKVVAWSDPIPFSIDTPDVERIYILMSSETTPTTPQSDELLDDYVPPLTTEKHVVGKTYNVGELVIGVDGKCYECIKTTTAIPIRQSTLDGGTQTNWIKSADWEFRNGWTDNPTGVTSDYRYEYESMRKKQNGKWGAFSTPVLWMVLPLNGTNGNDGTNGDFTEYRYAVSGTKAEHGVAFDPTKRNPGNSWTTTMPTVEDLHYLWLTTAKINGETNALRENWTTPIRVTPYDGTDGQPGEKGDSPALVFRGNFDPNATYYGNKLRVDVVKYNNNYYIRAIDTETTQGTTKGVYPTNTSKWNDFGAEFESIATGFLLAENANIANLIFRNQRLESFAKTNGIPNFYLDGLKNIASFGAGSVVFDGASAKIGWLNVIGRELLGFDDDGIQRLRLTPNELPSVNSASVQKAVVVKSHGGDATYTGTTDYEVSFEQDVHCIYGRDDMTDDVDMNFFAWFEVDIEEDSTLLDFGGSYQYSCAVKKPGTTNNIYLSCSVSAFVKRKVDTTWENIGGISLSDAYQSKITIPKAGRIRIELSGSVDEYIGYDCSGKFTFDCQGLTAKTAKTEMIIAKNGFMAIYNSNYLRMHSTEGFLVKFGNVHFKVTTDGIFKSTNGTKWDNL